jgi:hypothetical protein
MSNTAKKLADQLRFLRTLGATLLDPSKKLTPEERDFLGNALLKIGKGLDPKKELGIFVGKGQTTAKQAILKDQNLRIFCAWLNAAMEPCSEDEAGLSLEDAVATFAETGALNLSEETLRTYASRYKEYRQEIFEL